VWSILFIFKTCTLHVYFVSNFKSTTLSKSNKQRSETDRKFLSYDSNKPICAQFQIRSSNLIEVSKQLFIFILFIKLSFDLIIIFWLTKQKICFVNFCFRFRFCTFNWLRIGWAQSENNNLIIEPKVNLLLF